MNPRILGAWGVMRCSYSLFVLLACLPACDPDSKSAGQIPTATETSAETDPSGGGSCEAEIAADDYDRSCTQNSDCVTVFEGPSTDACRECASQAINVGDEASYLATLGPVSCSEGECGADCIASPGDPGACIDGRCELGQTIACGEEICNGAGQICLFFGSDIDGEPGVFSCIDTPQECLGSTDCACLASAESPMVNLGFCVNEGSCEHDGLAFQVTCPGG